jgi:hypothetical protein
MIKVNSITMVIASECDGTQHVQWVTDDAVMARLRKLAEQGDDRYASGDGLQSRILTFPQGFDISTWLKRNRLYLTTLDDLPGDGEYA